MDPQPRNTFNVAVIGAGLSGLCLAQSLKKSGIDVHVYERDDSAETRGQGYRITLDERGIRALEVCLPDSLFALFEATSGAPGGFFRFTRRDLREIFRLTFTASRAQSRYLPRQADRSTLRQILLCGLEDQVSFGKQCTRVEATALGATAHFADGTSAAATVLVGTDGAGSQVRPSLLPNAQPVSLGYSAIYGRTNLNTTDHPLVPGRLETSGVLAIGSPGKTFFFTTMAFRERPRDAFRRFMCKPPGRDQGDYVMWAISFPDASLPAATARGGSDALLQFAKEQAREFHVALRQMVDASEPGETLLVPLRMTPVKGWSSNSLTLMGDAVHLMPPTGSHGGNNALRDAALLGRALQEAAQGAIPVGDALARYQQEMLAYSSREVRAALRMLRLSLTRNPLIRVPLLKVLPVLHPVFQGSDGPVAVKRSTPKGDSSDH